MKIAVELLRMLTTEIYESRKDEKIRTLVQVRRKLCVKTVRDMPNLNHELRVKDSKVWLRNIVDTCTG